MDIMDIMGFEEDMNLLFSCQGKMQLIRKKLIFFNLFEFIFKTKTFPNIFNGICS